MRAVSIFLFLGLASTALMNGCSGSSSGGADDASQAETDSGDDTGGGSDTSSGEDSSAPDDSTTTDSTVTDTSATDTGADAARAFPVGGLWAPDGVNYDFTSTGVALTFHAIGPSSSPSSWYNAMSHGLVKVGDPWVKDIVPKGKAWSGSVLWKSGSSGSGVTEVKYAPDSTLDVNAAGTEIYVTSTSPFSGTTDTLTLYLLGPASDSAVPTDSLDPGDTAASDAPSTETGSSDADIGGGCNTVVQKGAAISQTAWTAAIPALTGGVIADGTWVLTKWAKTEGATPLPFTVAATQVISGTSWKVVATASSLWSRVTSVATTSGNTVTITQTCPGSSSSASTYTATATELILRDAANHDLQWFTKL